jgi:Xaa-Pro aminopeptidase
LIIRLALLLALVAQISSALESVPKSIYKQRRLALSEGLNRQCALLFAESEGDYHSTFRQDNNFYYLTGWTQPGAALLIVASRPDDPKDPHYKRPYTEILFLPEKPSELNSGPMLTARTPGIAEIAGVDHVDSIVNLASQLLGFGVRNSWDFYTDHAATSSNTTTTLAWLRAVVLRSGGTYDLAPILNATRAIKDKYEIALLKKAADASVAAHLAAMRATKPGLFEYEISTLMEYEFRRRGCERTAYISIAASGANAEFGHYNVNSARLKAGDLVLFDVAGEYSMYAADVTRTLPVGGKYTDRQRELYRAVRGAELAVINAFRAGQSTLYGKTNSLNKVYMDYLESHQLAKFAISGVGHPIGLNVHDGGETQAAYTLPLLRGSVFNIEPRIYLPDEKIGISIEDTFWVDPDGKLVNLTAGLPVEPEDIERVMAGAGQ